MSAIAFDALDRAPVDVCLVAEGCYPHVSGGVSSWIDWLIRSLPEKTFGVVSIVSGREDLTPRYERPANLTRLDVVALHDRPRPAPIGMRSRLGASGGDGAALAADLALFLHSGSLEALARIDALVRERGAAGAIEGETGWEALVGTYRALMPHASFAHFYWAWRSLVGGLVRVLDAPLPQARVYHAVSTGYAGLLAARAALAGARSVLTEHGIYTNERRIEVLMADWIVDTVDSGLSVADPRPDLRDLWTMAFESYARACYAACADITTLYGDNQDLQRALGAEPARLRVIPNGIDLSRFDGVRRAPGGRPTMALIGRVVPIKDVKTFVAAAAMVRRAVPDLRALVLGPTDEDPGYAAQCEALGSELGMGDALLFAGKVDIREWLGEIDVVVLTSLSEAQPLSLLEAGAAAIPCIATDVGSCREIIEGSRDESPALGDGGVVVPLGSTAEIAAACAALLRDPEERARMGERLRRRVRRSYGSDRARDAYRALYSDHRGGGA